MERQTTYRDRPRKYDVAVATMVPQEIADYLKTEAQARGTTVSGLLREILSDFVLAENPLA